VSDVSKIFKKLRVCEVGIKQLLSQGYLLDSNTVYSEK